MFNFNIGWDNFTSGEISPFFICLMGIGTVFVGLICLILVCKLLGVFCGSFRNQTQTEPAAAIIPAVSAADQPIENRQELLAAISAAVAEELGTDVNGIRITSFKKL